LQANQKKISKRVANDNQCFMLGKWDRLAALSPTDPIFHKQNVIICNSAQSKEFIIFLPDNNNI